MSENILLKPFVNEKHGKLDVIIEHPYLNLGQLILINKNNSYYVTKINQLLPLEQFQQLLRHLFLFSYNFLQR